LYLNIFVIKYEHNEDGTLRKQIFLNVSQFILLLEEEALEIDKQNNVGAAKGYTVIDHNRLNLR
jgi:hypothetical protein